MRKIILFLTLGLMIGNVYADEDIYCPSEITCIGGVCSLAQEPSTQYFVITFPTFPYRGVLPPPDGTYSFVTTSPEKALTQTSYDCYYQHPSGYYFQATSTINLQADIKASPNSWQIEGDKSYGCNANDSNHSPSPCPLLPPS